jgi:hypothetical protein
MINTFFFISCPRVVERPSQQRLFPQSPLSSHSASRSDGKSPPPPLRGRRCEPRRQAQHTNAYMRGVVIRQEDFLSARHQRKEERKQTGPVRGQSKERETRTTGARRFQRTAPAVVAPISLRSRVVELFWEEDSDLLRWSASEVRCAALRSAARVGGRAWAQVCCADRARHRRRRSRYPQSSAASRCASARAASGACGMAAACSFRLLLNAMCWRDFRAAIKIMPFPIWRA